MSRESPAQEYKGMKALKEEDGADTLQILDEGSHDLRKRLERRWVSIWEMKVSVHLQNPATQETTEELSFAAPLALPSSFVRHDLPCKLSVFRDPSSFQM